MVGGCGILLLTKLGGFLFDKVSPGAPFYIMALLNLLALVSAVIVILIDMRAPKISLEDLEYETIPDDEDDFTDT
jgi:hypothetical protein